MCGGGGGGPGPLVPLRVALSPRGQLGPLGRLGAVRQPAFARLPAALAVAALGDFQHVAPAGDQRDHQD